LCTGPPLHPPPFPTRRSSDLVSYDPVRDFVPVVLVSTSPLLLVVRPMLPAKNVSELIALARGKPGALSFGSYGTGSINHLGAERSEEHTSELQSLRHLVCRLL